jgi:hypothetical protein
LGRDLLLQRLEEELLARVAEEIGVEVAVPHEGECIRGVQPLVARKQVDLGHARTVGGIAQVAMVDVDPDATEVVHELREAAEVDGDEVVDRQPGERPHRLHTAE